MKKIHMQKDWSNMLNSKEDFRNLLLSMLNLLIPYYSEEKAELLLGVTATNYEQKSIRLEVFSRPLWGLKTFAVLMLPDDHPFWMAKAECSRQY